MNEHSRKYFLSYLGGTSRREFASFCNRCLFCVSSFDVHDIQYTVSCKWATDHENEKGAPMTVGPSAATIARLAELKGWTKHDLIIMLASRERAIRRLEKKIGLREQQIRNLAARVENNSNEKENK